MTADSFGSKGQPQFIAGGVVAIDVDPSQVADYAALVGNHIAGTTTQRNANVVPNGSGKAVWEGLWWTDTTDGNTYRRVGSSWILVASPLNTSSPFASFGSGISAGAGMDVFKIDGSVHATFYFSKATPILASELLATLNLGWRPASVVACGTGIPAACGLRIDGTNGQITMVGSPASTAVLAAIVFRQVN